MKSLVGALDAMGTRLPGETEGDPFTALCSFANRAAAEVNGSGFDILSGLTPDQSTLVIVFVTAGTREHLVSVQSLHGQWQLRTA